MIDSCRFSAPVQRDNLQHAAMTAISDNEAVLCRNTLQRIEKTFGRRELAAGETNSGRKPVTHPLLSLQGFLSFMA